MDTVSGVYKIRNLKNGKYYIGSAKNFAKRWSVHKTRLKQGKHDNRHLQMAWNKYGADTFVFEIVETGVEIAQLIPREQYWIDSADFTQLYNVNPTAGNSLGHRHTDTAKEKIRQARLGKPLSAEIKERMSKGHLGKTLSAETKEKVSKGHLGIYPSDEARQKMRDNHRSHPHTAESIRKIREAHLGYKHTTAARQKISKTRRQTSKITWDDVRVMRALCSPRPGRRKLVLLLSARFDICVGQIYLILRNKQWIDPGYHPGPARKRRMSVTHTEDYNV